MSEIYQNSFVVECKEEMKEIIEFYSITYLTDWKSNLYLRLAALQIKLYQEIIFSYWHQTNSPPDLLLLLQLFS